MAKHSKDEVFQIVRKAIGDTPNVDFFPESRLTWQGCFLQSILEKTAENMLADLDKMSESEAFYPITREAYERIPEDVGNRKIHVYKVGGGPGCGKTTVIKKICKEEELCTVMVPFKRLKADYTVERCFTQHTCVVREMATKILLVDEFTGCDVGLVCAAALNQGCSKVILWGDVLQIWLQDAEGQGFKDFKIPDFAVMRGNYRNPRSDVLLLNSLFGDNMAPMKSGEGVQVRELFGDPLEEEGVNLTFSRQSVDELSHRYFMDAITVRSSQGATYDKVNLFVFMWDLNMFTNAALLRVALSRHRVRLVIYTCHTPSARDIVETGRITNDQLVGIDHHEIKASLGLVATIKRLLGY